MPKVMCCVCKKERLSLSHEQLRDMVERGELPMCDEHKVAKGERYVDLSVRDLILVAMFRLGGCAHVDDITVKAWQMAPSRLSLRGHDYPDSHRVYMDLVKLDKKDIEWVSMKTYQLTLNGRVRATVMSNELAAANRKSSGRGSAGSSASS